MMRKDFKNLDIYAAFQPVNGAADIPKQLFLFNISFDFGLTVLIYMLFKTVSKKLSKKVSKNS